MIKKKNTQNIPISLYIHIPWCKKKCPYCDFHSYKNSRGISDKKYIYHLIQDYKKEIKYLKNRKIISIFIGGGTPNLIKTKYLKILLTEIEKLKKNKKNLEISIEVNPDNITWKKIIQYYIIGINRISIGIQTFNKNSLKYIQRLEFSNKKIEKTIKKTKKIKKRNLNIDLMYGLPNQKTFQALKDLKKAIKLSPEHISWYQFTLEPNTKFYKEKIILPSEHQIEKIFQKGTKILKKNGYIQYEISAYSKQKKYKCQHNLNYWTFGDYLGIGCGAHGKITLENNTIIRTIKTKNDVLYTQGKYLEKVETVKKDIIFEFFLNNFRLNQPIYYNHFEKYTFLNIYNIKKQIDNAIQKGYLKKNNYSWNITQNGKKFMNDLLTIFL